MPNSLFFRSTSVRLSIAFAGLVVTSFLLVGSVIWLVARHSAEKELRQDIQLELVAIRTELESEGLGATIAAINARAEHPGALATRHVLSRINDLSTTFERVTAGDIAARFPASGSASDIEQIGIGVNKMLDRIKELVTDVRRVSRDVAHDLRTPLTHLTQRLEQASSERSPTARVAAIEGAQQKAQVILRIFDAIVRLAEIEAGAGRQRFKTVDLADVVERIVDAYRPDIEESNHRVRVADMDTCIVRGDEDLLSQAVANLVENAMRHTPAGTEMTLRVFSSGAAKGFEVSDNGSGVPPDAIDLIQKPFIRLDQSRTTPGSGLGLSLVAAIARFHDAELTISEANPGLRVTLTFSSCKCAS